MTFDVIQEVRTDPQMELYDVFRLGISESECKDVNMNQTIAKEMKKLNESKKVSDKMKMLVLITECLEGKYVDNDVPEPSWFRGDFFHHV